MVAELLQGRDLRADGDLLAEDLHRRCTALDDRAAGSRSLESDKEDQIFRVGKTLHKVMLDASAGRHAAGRDDDAGEFGVVDLLRIFDFVVKIKILPGQRRAILGDELLGFVAELFAVLEKNLHCLHRHRGIGVHRQARDLAGFHHVFQHEENFLRALHGEGGDNDTAAASNGRVNQLGEFRARVAGGMQAIAVGGFHHQHVRRFALGRAGVDDASGSDLGVAHTADVASEKQGASGAVELGGDLGE